MKMSLKPPALVVVMALTGRFGQLSCAAAGTSGGQQRKQHAARNFMIISLAFSSACL